MSDKCRHCGEKTIESVKEVRDTFGGRKELRRVRECVSGKHREILPKSGGS